jgi:hypothetical protein
VSRTPFTKTVVVLVLKNCVKQKREGENAVGWDNREIAE